MLRSYCTGECGYQSRCEFTVKLNESNRKRPEYQDGCDGEKLVAMTESQWGVEQSDGVYYEGFVEDLRPTSWMSWVCCWRSCWSPQSDAEGGKCRPPGHPHPPPLSAADHCIKDHRCSLLKAVLILVSFDLFDLILRAVRYWWGG